jgi:bacteriocin-like protein
MTQEHPTPQTTAMQSRDAFAPDPSELTDAELAHVVGGGEARSAPATTTVALACDGPVRRAAARPTEHLGGRA